MGGKIMIVDDEEDLRYSISTLLKTEGYDMREATTREEALKKLESEPVDLILLDIMMPGMRPIDFIGKIKSDPRLSSVKVAYLSAVSFTKESKTDLINKGLVVDYITKPIDNEDFLARINTILS